MQVSTLHRSDTEVQVDTLPHPHRLTSRGAYALELDVALRECGEHLRGLERLLEPQEDSRGSPTTHNTVVSRTQSMYLIFGLIVREGG